METDKTVTGTHFILPNKHWFTLQECCELKGLNYKTACNKKWLQPNKGKTYVHIGGRKAWSYETVSDWISVSDEQLSL